ncbi:HalD/BesD family halogenase [Candidatus Spongiihabitans sp.]
MFSDFVLAEMRTEAFALLELNKVRRDVTIKTTDNTFRQMSNVSA